MQHVAHRRTRRKAPTADEEARFRITVWPGGNVPVPAMTPWTVQVLEGEYLYYDMPKPEVRLPDELFLREVMDADPDDPVTAVQFTNTCGPLTGFGERAYAFLPASVTYLDPFPGLLLEAQQCAERAKLHASYVVALAGVRIHLHAIRAMVRHWDVHLQGGSDEAVADVWQGEGMQRPRMAQDAWDFFRDHLNAGLQPFQTHVEVARSDDVRMRSGVRDANLYNALCLQLFNEMAAGSTFRRCANETCLRPFVHQRGSKYGQHRSDAIYCTPECARMQAQREYRRRKRAARES